MQSWFTPIRYKVYFGRSKVTFSSVSAFYGPPEIQRYEEVGACFHTMLLAEPFERENTPGSLPLTKPTFNDKAILKIFGTFTCDDTGHITNSFCKTVPTRATLYPV
jgi:hypothetical protein